MNTLQNFDYHHVVIRSFYDLTVLEPIEFCTKYEVHNYNNVIIFVYACAHKVLM